MRNARKNVAIYEDLDDYVQAVSEKASPNVNLDNVQLLFLNFGGFLVLVSFVSVMHLVLFKQIYRKLLVGFSGWTRNFRRFAFHKNGNQAGELRR